MVGWSETAVPDPEQPPQPPWIGGLAGRRLLPKLRTRADFSIRAGFRRLVEDQALARQRLG